MLKPSDSHLSGGFNVVQFNSVVQMLCKKKALTLIFNELRLFCVPRTGDAPSVSINSMHMEGYRGLSLGANYNFSITENMCLCAMGPKMLLEICR